MIVVSIDIAWTLIIVVTVWYLSKRYYSEPRGWERNKVWIGGVMFMFFIFFANGFLNMLLR